MRPLLIALALAIASTVSAQSGEVWVAGPYQPSRVSPGYLYYNPTAPYYPVAANPFGAGHYGGWRQQVELRRVRWAIEDANAYRGW